LVGSLTSTLLYAVATIAAPFSSVAALTLLVFVPAMFNLLMLLRRDRQRWRIRNNNLRRVSSGATRSVEALGIAD
jgi:hypothetical protein